MTGHTGIDWPTCDGDGCIGIRLPRGGTCLAHAPAQRRNAALKRLRQTGAIDARGVPITKELLDQILAAAPRDRGGSPKFAAARFDQATFQGPAGFSEATFEGDAWFLEATFQGAAGFDGATFRGDARFGGATFQGVAGFDGATFQGDASFGLATFGSVTSFSGATFQDDAWFAAAIFQGGALFSRATFGLDAWFGAVTFRGGASFGGATFQDDAWFGGATFDDVWFDEATFQSDAKFHGVIVRRDAGFPRAQFEQARQLGPLLVYGVLWVDGAQFAQLTLIEASSRGLSCQRTRFPTGVQFRLRGAHVVLDDADLPSPSLLILQPHLPVTSLVVCTSGSGLMASAPA